MRGWLLAVLVSAAVVTAAAADPPEIKFLSSPFFRLPTTMSFGEVAGVATTSTANHFYVFSRGNVSGPSSNPAAAQLLEFDSAGRFVRELAPGLYAWSFAHAVRVDRQNNIWVVDSGSDTVVKLDPNGQVLMVLGRRRPTNTAVVPWDPSKLPKPVEGMFREPTDVTWDANDNIYVADGHVNARIAKFDKLGRWVTSFGEPGNKDGQLNTPHSIVADTAGNIYVGDAGNRRIQVFDVDGKYLRKIEIEASVPTDAPPILGPIPTADEAKKLSGTPWAMCIPPSTQVMFVADEYPGRIYKVRLSDGAVLGMFGESGRQPKQFGSIHALACPSETQLFTAETATWRVQRLLLQ